MGEFKNVKDLGLLARDAVSLGLWFSEFCLQAWSILRIIDSFWEFYSQMAGGETAAQCRMWEDKNPPLPPEHLISNLAKRCLEFKPVF